MQVKDCCAAGHGLYRHTPGGVTQSNLEVQLQGSAWICNGYLDGRGPAGLRPEDVEPDWALPWIDEMLDMACVHRRSCGQGTGCRAAGLCKVGWAGCWTCRCKLCFICAQAANLGPQGTHPGGAAIPAMAAVPSARALHVIDLAGGT